MLEQLFSRHAFQNRRFHDRRGFLAAPGMLEAEFAKNVSSRVQRQQAFLPLRRRHQQFHLSRFKKEHCLGWIAAYIHVLMAEQGNRCDRWGLRWQSFVYW